MANLTKKQFVLEVTESLKSSAKTVLSGHGLNGQMLGIIASRPDIIAKLVQFTTSTVNWKKGKSALKKAKNFKISAYKNFNDFNKRGQLDVDKFVDGLTPKDAETFVANNNVYVLLCLPEKTHDDENLENEIANSKSLPLRYDKAVTSQYKIPSGFYITIMFGDSLILTKAMAKAEREKNINLKKVDRANKIATVKKTFVNKNKAKIAGLNKEIDKISKDLQHTKNIQENLASKMQTFAIKSGKVADIKAGKQVYDRTIKNQLLKLDDADNVKLEQARDLWKTGYQKDAMNLVKSIKSPAERKVLREYVMNDGMIHANAIIDKDIAKAKDIINATKRQISDVRKSLKSDTITPLARKKAKAEIERLNTRKRLQETKLEHASKLRDNKSLSVKSDADKLAEKIQKLSGTANTLEQVTRKAVNQMQLALSEKQQLIAKINGNVAQQVAQIAPETIDNTVAQQIISDAVQQALIDVNIQEIKSPETSGLTPLEIKKAKAEKERELKRKQVVKQQQIAQQKAKQSVDANSPQKTVDNTVAKINGSISKTGKGSNVAPKNQAPKHIVNDAKKQQNNVGGTNKITPLARKKAKAEKEREMKRKQIANQQVNVTPIQAPKPTPQPTPQTAKQNVAQTANQSNQKFEMDLVNGNLLDEVLSFI